MIIFSARVFKYIHIASRISSAPFALTNKVTQSFVLFSKKSHGTEAHFHMTADRHEPTSFFLLSRKTLFNSKQYMNVIMMIRQVV